MKNKTIMKTIAEIYLIPICFIYLLYMLLNNHSFASLIICSIIVFFTSLELLIKYLKEVYIYKNKYNVLKIAFGIFNIALIVIMALNIFYKLFIIKLLFIIGVIILLLFLLGYSIYSAKNYTKDTKKTMFVVKSFFSFLSFCGILITFLIYVF